MIGIHYHLTYSREHEKLYIPYRFTFRTTHRSTKRKMVRNVKFFMHSTVVMATNTKTMLDVHWYNRQFLD